MKITKSQLKETVKTVVKKQLNEMLKEEINKKAEKAEKKEKQKLAIKLVQDFFNKEENREIRIDTARRIVSIAVKLSDVSHGYSIDRLTQNFTPARVEALRIMENSGLTDRIKKDSRSWYVTLTVKGRDLAREIKKLML